MSTEEGYTLVDVTVLFCCIGALFTLSFGSVIGIGYVWMRIPRPPRPRSGCVRTMRPTRTNQTNDGSNLDAYRMKIVQRLRPKSLDQGIMLLSF